MADNTTNHIAVNPAELSALSRSYQDISHRVSGISTIAAAAPESTELAGALPGSRIIAAANDTCSAWAEALRGASAGIDTIAVAAETLAAEIGQHQLAESAALEAIAWSR